MLSPEINKVLQGTPDLNDLGGTLLFGPKLNGLLVDVGYSALGNDRTAGISSAILKKVLNRPRFFNMLVLGCIREGSVMRCGFSRGDHPSASFDASADSAA